MLQATTNACNFTDDMDKEGFIEDLRTQQAVLMNLMIIGEAATKIMDGYAEFAQTHAHVPWRSLRGMRNRITHGYFDINLEVVWDTVKIALPELSSQLPKLIQDAILKPLVEKPTE